MIEVAGIDISWAEVLRTLVVLAAAYGLALPVGWDREQRVRSGILLARVLDP